MKWKSVLLLVLLIAALVMIKLLWLQPKNEKTPQTGNAKGGPSMVTGYVVKSQALNQKIFSSGTLLANEEVALHAEVSGKLLAIYFKEGQLVKKGALLAKINDADLQAQLKRLQYQYQLANEKSKRLHSLLNIQGISQQEYDESANQLNLIQADMSYTRALIAKTEIRAPFTGIIGLRDISEGSYVSPSTPLATIQQTNILKLDFTVPEKYAHLLQLGDQVQFTLDNQSTPQWATVVAMEPKIDAETRTLLVRARCQGTQGLLPGAFARVELKTRQQASAFMIPTEAVIPELKGKKVFLCKSGKAVPTKIVTGLRTDAQIEIVQGVQEGDTVIITGIMSLKPDAAVKITSMHNP